MTFPSRSAFLNKAELWQWLSTAPLPVVFSICLSFTALLGGWVWLIAGDASTDRAAIAVAVEQASAAKAAAATTDARLARLELKLDRLIEAVADLRAERAVSTHPSRPRTVDTTATEKNQ